MTDDARLDFAALYWDSRNHAERRGIATSRIAGEPYDSDDIPSKDEL